MIKEISLLLDCVFRGRVELRGIEGNCGVGEGEAKTSMQKMSCPLLPPHTTGASWGDRIFKRLESLKGLVPLWPGCGWVWWWIKKGEV